MDAKSKDLFHINTLFNEIFSIVLNAAKVFMEHIGGTESPVAGIPEPKLEINLTRF
jgi:hypothetical protein